ncbi:LacI family DNA-binding transcriptional regulator [Psychromarinibacter halotolerans]|uniref:LacI family DNA-binding transcriptional regulator n=1 Tax=Psychromarinibacter halotolerans TaxID=1775175 RepID=A0ABV7GWC7_9RHOB|nr:LacI family DNA-binding transcriptional regulator [Psychromarinibacter halotolerans]MDF0595147.1 LacI family DNA-binding transcriptional regulator [Psychromarinibacter halotolerans]
MSDKRVRIGDISKELGLSSSTVSRALSGKGYVAAEVKARVVEAARRMGYVPDLTARNLRRRSSTQVGLVVSSLLDPFYAQLATGFQSVARRRGYEVVLIIDGADPGEEKAAVESLLAMGVGGIAMTPVSDEALARVEDYGICTLQLDRSVSSRYSLIGGDNRAGGVIATEHLLSNGHRDIAVLVDHDRWTTGFERIAGWRDAFTRAGLTPPEDLCVKLGDTREDIETALRTVVPRLVKQGVTAIFAANSQVAQLLYTALQDQGLSVPDDVSLVAYDDANWTEMVRPAISVITQHVDMLGQTAADQLIGMIEAPKAEAPSVGAPVSRFLVQPTLVERDSVRTLTPDGSA